ncbi:ectoine/hydroxyectoine ABC transporter substrate-binding protein EhuB [Bosea sp. BH3]|uniref:ectoine/hydroxyectoine ABC transporter substrate-binding protein EhuB n=1 Tax=Bosea sp. BH3 TaxID=2871701 RepID=UPI0021CB1383|nr:ectoine/hydroxyectoine ABC transporter substrate-binding protein EhuB [Bosea sp. BH3]MCU4179776.1 ectoine/hydroxyectoine ABC transporter substrate-binding protein EhuB [Bosea sp. BH3]
MTVISRRRLPLLLAGAVAALSVFGGLHSSKAQAQTSEWAGKKLVVGIHNRTPWAYRDKDSNVVGIHSDVIRAVFAPLGVKDFEFVVSDFGAMIPGLLAGRFDIIASGVAITPPRCEQVLFSEPDVAVGDSLLVKKGNPLKLHSYEDIAKNPKVRLAGGRGSENTKNAIAAGVPESQIALFPNNEAAVSAILADRADVTTLSVPSAIGVIDEQKVEGIERAVPFKGLIKPNGQPAKLYTGTVFPKSSAKLRDAYNAELAKLRASGGLKPIMEKYNFTADEDAGSVTTEQICAGNG